MEEREIVIEGRVAWIFGDNFDIDLVIGMENLSERDPKRLAELCMVKFEPEFRSKAKPGDIVIGGRNFGYGHAHPQSMTALKEVGVKAIVAESFSPPFYRGETSGGSVLIECPGVSQFASRWDVLRVEALGGVLTNLTTGGCLSFEKPVDPVLHRIRAGGVYNYVLEKLSLKN
jgi:3-isopropylmalate/(R)-2-methylmalate dehydratase small subunit